MKIIKYFKSILFISITIFFIGCGTIDNTGENIVGKNFVSASILQDVNASTNLVYVKAKIDANATSAFAYRVVKIIYDTKDEKDNAVKASGILVFPVVTQAFLTYYKTTYGKNFSISTILENHGTIFPNSQAPSNEITTVGSGTQGLGVLMTARAGFAIAMPDYLGYGESNSKAHPYILKKASARVSIDMLKASFKYMTDNSILSNGQVYISGYSEGGYIAMATAQEIEKNYSDEFKLKGVAPMDGPYDVKALGNIEINATHLMQYPAFLGYLASSYALNYNDIDLNTILNTDINRTIYDALFDGSKTNVEIHTALGLVTDARGGFKQHNADKLFNTNFISDYQSNINNSLKVRLEENSVFNWTPKTKMNLIHCIDDEIIPYSMATTAKDKFIANGATGTNITLTSLPTAILTQQVDATHPFIHGNCGATAYGAAVTWFAKIRSGEIQ